MNVAKGNLPKPRQERQDSVRARDRTPLSNKVPKISEQNKVQAQKQGQRKAKRKAKAGRRAKNRKPHSFSFFSLSASGP